MSNFRRPRKLIISTYSFDFYAINKYTFIKRVSLQCGLIYDRLQYQ